MWNRFQVKDAMSTVMVGMVLVLLAGCRKPDDDLGLDILPGDELGLSVLESALRAYTFPDSVVRTSGLTRNLVGAYNDPDFGTVHTSLVTQLRLTTNNIGQGQDNTGLQADSVVLALAFDVPVTHYGNLNAQRFHVYELMEALSVDSVYYTDDLPIVGVEDLVFPHAGLLTPQPTVQPAIGGDTLVPQLRIRLKDDLAERFLEEFGAPGLVDNTAFLNFFKGLHVTVDSASQVPFQGGILHINTLSTASKLTVYYKDANSAEPELSRTLDLAINSNCVRYTVASRNATQAGPLMTALSDTTAPAPALYLQSLGALRNAVRFPGLMSYAERGSLLSKAELVVPVRGTYYPYYTPPAQVFIFRRSATGADLFLPDQLDGIAGIGGQFSSTDQEYRFNITRYIQQVLNGSIPDNGLELVPGSSGVSANRVILCGPDHPQQPMRLQLTFTTY